VRSAIPYPPGPASIAVTAPAVNPAPRGAAQGAGRLGGRVSGLVQQGSGGLRQARREVERGARHVRETVARLLQRLQRAERVPHPAGVQHGHRGQGTVAEGGAHGLRDGQRAVAGHGKGLPGQEVVRAPAARRGVPLLHDGGHGAGGVAARRQGLGHRAAPLVPRAG